MFEFIVSQIGPASDFSILGNQYFQEIFENVVNLELSKDSKSAKKIS